MTYCPQCGYAIREGVAICPSCGTKALYGTTPVKEEIKEESIAQILVKAEEDAPAPEKEQEVFPIPEPAAQQKEDPPVKTSYSDNVLPTGRYAVLSTGGYLLNQLVFMIPVIGLIAAIIMACASKKTNRRRHALSAVILHIIFLVLAGGIAGISAVFGYSAVVAAITEWLKVIA